MVKRCIVRLHLDADEHYSLELISERRGTTKVQLLSRLILWFVKQREAIQNSILQGTRQNSDSSLSEQLLEQLASAHALGNN